MTSMKEKRLPWGKLQVVGACNEFDAALETVEPGKRLPLCFHKTSTAVVCVLKGTGRCLGKKVRRGSVLVFKPGQKHELVNTSKKDLVFAYICMPPFKKADFVLVRKRGTEKSITRKKKH